MNPIQAAADPSPYLIPNEQPIIEPRRHHVIVGLLPAIHASLFAIFSAYCIAQLGPLGFIPVGLVLVYLATRKQPVIRRIARGLLAAVVVMLLLFLLISPATGDGQAGFVLMFATLGYAVWGYVDYLMTWVFLTDKRIFRVNGILTRSVATLPLKALTDIRYDRPLIGRYLKYGHFYIESAGQHQALSALQFIGHPNEFYGVVMEEALKNSTDSHHPGIPGSG